MSGNFNQVTQTLLSIISTCRNAELRQYSSAGSVYGQRVLQDHRWWKRLENYKIRSSWEKRTWKLKCWWDTKCGSINAKMSQDEGMRLLNTIMLAASDKAYPRLFCGQHFKPWTACSVHEQLQGVPFPSKLRVLQLACFKPANFLPRRQSKFSECFYSNENSLHYPPSKPFTFVPIKHLCVLLNTRVHRLLL